MRPSLLPNLIAAAARNRDRGHDDFGLFEVGQTYAGDRPEEEGLFAAGVRAGRTGKRHWAARPRAVDAFDAKGDALALLRELGVATDRLQTTADAPSWYHPGRSGMLRLGKLALARFGEVHPAILDAFDTAAPVVAFEVDLAAIPEPKAARTARPALKAALLQPVERDFAFVVDRAMPAERIVQAARGADRTLIEEVSVFDVFEGAGLGAGKKSVAVSVTLQPRERTLTEDEIAAVASRVIGAVEKATGGTLRA